MIQLSKTSSASSALCHTATTCGFLVTGICMLIGIVAMWFLLSLEILPFDWSVNWLGNSVPEGVYPPPGGPHTHTHTHTHDRLDKSPSALAEA